MSLARVPDSDEEAVAPFLERIRARTEQQISEIEQSLEDESARLRGAAWRRSRDLHRDQAQRARRNQQQERDRRLSRARSELRRRRWDLLRELQDEALWSIFETMRRNWRVPERQLAWCRHWLQLARQIAGATPIQLRLGGGASADTVEALQRALGESGGRVTVDEQLPAGILCEWSHLQLDGTLEAQRSQLEAQVFEELTHWLHESDGTNVSEDESR
jgi:hypothetical protein